MEAFICLQIYRGTHSDLRIDYVGDEALDILEAAVDEALLVVDQIEEKNVKACGQNRGHVGQPVPEDNVHVVVLNHLIHYHHSLILALNPVVFCVALNGVPHKQLLIYELEEHEIAQRVRIEYADHETPRENLSIEVLLQQDVRELVLSRRDLLS